MKSTLPILLLTTFLSSSALPTMAQPAGSEDLDWQWRHQGLLKVSGTLTGFKHLKLREGHVMNEHTLIRLKFEDGERWAIGLGRKVDARELGLENGDQLVVFGSPDVIEGGKYDEKRIIVATRIQVDGKEYKIKRPYRGGEQLIRTSPRRGK